MNSTRIPMPASSAPAPVAPRRDRQAWMGGTMGDETTFEGRASWLHASLAVVKRFNYLVRGRQAAGLLLGIDFLPVNENVQRAEPAKADASGNLQ